MGADDGTKNESSESCRDGGMGNVNLVCDAEDDGPSSPEDWWRRAMERRMRVVRERRREGFRHRVGSRSVGPDATAGREMVEGRGDASGDGGSLEYASVSVCSWAGVERGRERSEDQVSGELQCELLAVPSTAQKKSHLLIYVRRRLLATEAPRSSCHRLGLTGVDSRH